MNIMRQMNESMNWTYYTASIRAVPMPPFRQALYLILFCSCHQCGRVAITTDLVSVTHLNPIDDGVQNDVMRCGVVSFNASLEVNLSVPVDPAGLLFAAQLYNALPVHPPSPPGTRGFSGRKGRQAWFRSPTSVLHPRLCYRICTRSGTSRQCGADDETRMMAMRKREGTGARSQEGWEVKVGRGRQAVRQGGKGRERR
jgi:hypothetical protein